MVLRIRLLWIFLLVASIGAAHGQTLRWAARGDSRSMDPYAFGETVNHNLSALVYDALVERDARQQIVPALALRWSQPDRLTWRFTLRPGVLFHDGSPFTAADVVFSIQRAQQLNSSYTTFAKPLGTPVAIDANTLELRLARPNPLVLQQLSAIMIMSRDWSIANKVENVPSPAGKEQAYSANAAIGTGRFVLKERLPGVRTVFERNPKWWGRFEGNVTEVVYLPIENDSTRSAALLAGDVNFVQDVPPQDLPRIGAAAGLRLVNGVENRLILLGFDQGREELQYASVRGKNPFKDVRVREAFSRAIDVQALQASIMRGQSLPTGCLAIAANGCAAVELESRATADPARAKELLAQAGYPDGFEVTLNCPNDRYMNDRQLCVAMVGMLARAGIRLKVEAQPKSLYFPRLVATDTSFYLYGWGGFEGDAQTLLDSLVHSRDAVQTKGSNNYGRFADPELDRLIDAAGSELAPEARAALIRDAQRRAAENFYYLPLHRQMLTWAARANVRLVMTADNLVRADWIRIE